MAPLPRAHIAMRQQNEAVRLPPEPHNHPSICPGCAPHSGHEAGKCNACLCAVESRPGQSEFVVRGYPRQSGYCQRLTGIGPQFGASKKDALRFKTQWEVAAAMSRWPVIATVGCRVVTREPPAPEPPPAIPPAPKSSVRPKKAR